MKALAVQKKIAVPAAGRQVALGGLTGGGIEGASTAEREMMSWHPRFISPDQAINLAKPLADARSQDIAQNDGLIGGAVSMHRDSIVGSCYRLNAQPDWRFIGSTKEWAEEFQQVVESRFNLIAESESCWLDAARRETLTGLTRLVVAGFVTTGEGLATAEWIKESVRPYSTAVQLVSPARLCNENGNADNRNLRRGVALSDRGRPVGYWFRQGYPSEIWDSKGYEWKYVLAEKPWGRKQVIHIVERNQIDQTRGIADMVAALKHMKMTKMFSEMTLQNAVINASYAAAIESEMPRDALFSMMGGNQADPARTLEATIGSYMSSLQKYLEGSNSIKIGGAKIPHLFPGTKLNMMPMGTPGGIGTGFEESLLRKIAAILGLSYEEFARDFTKTNYSSARASMGITWRGMQARKKVVADRFATNVYSLQLEEMINAGDVPMPPGKGRGIFYLPLMKEAFTKCSWIGASRGQIDELKETQAAVLRIASGLSTYEIESARLGTDFRDLFDQAQREQKMIRDKKLLFTLETKKPTANTDQSTDPGADQQLDPAGAGSAS